MGCALNLCPSDSAREIKILHRKLLAGADFILTQPVYEPGIAKRFLKRYAGEFGPLETPILVGVLPLYGPRHASFLHNEVPGISVPDTIHRRLMDTGEHSPQEGVSVALKLIDQMKSWVSGIYLIPAFSRYDLAAEIVEACR